MAPPASYLSRLRMKWSGISDQWQMEVTCAASAAREGVRWRGGRCAGVHGVAVHCVWGGGGDVVGDVVAVVEGQHVERRVDVVARCDEVWGIVQIGRGLGLG